MFQYLIFFGFLAGAGFAILMFCIKVQVRKSRENEYFRRMYWTMRQAQEDANRDRDKGKQNKND